MSRTIFLDMKKYAIIVAGGSGTRMKSDIPKQFLQLNHKPVLWHTLRAFESVGDISVILVLPEAQIGYWKKLLVEIGETFRGRIVTGGETRFHSVKNGLLSIEDEENTLVAVHDGVRPLVSPELIRRSYESAEAHGSAITAVALKDSLRQINREGSTPADRESFRLVQTPQTFRIDWMQKAFNTEYLPHFTDCASVLEQAGYPVRLIEGDYKNIKITTPEDLMVAEAFLETTSR